MMIAADIVRATTQGAFAVALLTEHAWLWTLALLQVVYGAATGVFNPAAGALVPLVVPRHSLPQVNARIATLRSVARVAGPIAAATVVASGDVAWLFVVDAATFVASAGALSWVRTSPREPGAYQEREQFRHRVFAGYAAARRQPWILICIAYFAAFQFLALAPLFVLGPYLLGADGEDSSIWGLFLAAGGLGWIAGGIAAGRLRTRRPLVICFYLSLLDGVQLVALSLDVGVPVLLVLGFAAGMVGTIWQVLWTTCLQLKVPSSVLGRVWALDEFGSVIAAPIAFAVLGLLATRYDASLLAIACACAISVVSVVCALSPHIRSVTNLKELERAR